MIKQIILDIGYVLVDYRPTQMLMDHGYSLEQAHIFERKVFDSPYWAILDLGTLSQEQVIEGYSMIYPEDAGDIEWFITHGELMYIPRPAVWDLVHKCKEKGYGIYILSNYSADLLEKHTKGASFWEDADGKVVSYQVHMAKPDERIYRHLLRTYGLDPSECIFYDDRQENTEAARKCGIEAVTITSEAHILEELQKRLDHYGE